MRPSLLLPLALSWFVSSPVCAAPLAEAIGDRIVRFHADEVSRAGVLPSLALERPRPPIGPAPHSFRTRPEFTSSGGGRIVRIAVERGTNLYGTGEVGGPLERTGRTIVCWNTDAYAYRADSPSLYQSHPWVLAVRADGSAYGVLADTPGRVVVDLTDGIVFRAQGPPFAVLAIERGSPDSVVMALAELTGRMPMPPRWALGFQQSRFSYAPDREVLRVARGFRERRIPCM
jgi:alpha-glucosidase